MNEIRTLLTRITSEAAEPSGFSLREKNEREHLRGQFEALRTLYLKYRTHSAIGEFFQSLKDSQPTFELPTETMRRAARLAKELLARDARELEAEKRESAKETYQRINVDLDPFLQDVHLSRDAIPMSLAPEPDPEVRLDAWGNVVPE